MIFDTDIIIWYLRGNTKAAKAIDTCDNKAISVMTYMELLQGARDKSEQKTIRSMLTDLGFQTISLTENIGHRAAIYMEEYSLKVAMCAADAIIGATAVETSQELYTANNKHYKPISDLDIKIFRP